LPNPFIVLVGGFLGAGKTTLILTACRILSDRGMKVAAIMNDQDTGLVDTRFASANLINTREVAGGCFCCRFSELIEAADDLRSFQPDVIFAEPVGSCIDLSATILQPLKAFHRGSYRIAPLTVIFDPSLADEVYSGRADPDTDYLVRKQIDEADILCSTKSDLYGPSKLPPATDFSLSAKTGRNVELWLEEVMRGSRVAGSQLLQVDYSRYGEAEAAMGWLNLHAQIRLTSPASPALLAGPLMEDIESGLTSAGLSLAHLKIFAQAPSGFIKASISNGSASQADGDLLADPALEHELAINLRAIADPEQLSEIVSVALSRIDGRVTITHQRSFRPTAPKPEHRFPAVFKP
jgi:hypothetical protein